MVSEREAVAGRAISDDEITRNPAGLLHEGGGLKDLRSSSFGDVRVWSSS